MELICELRASLVWCFAHLKALRILLGSLIHSLLALDWGNTPIVWRGSLIRMSLETGRRDGPDSDHCRLLSVSTCWQACHQRGAIWTAPAKRRSGPPMQAPPAILHAVLARPAVAATVSRFTIQPSRDYWLMKREQATPRMDVAASEKGQPLAPLRPRHAGMDALVKHVHASEKFSFQTARTAIGAALSRVKPAR